MLPLGEMSCIELVTVNFLSNSRGVFEMGGEKISHIYMWKLVGRYQLTKANVVLVFLACCRVIQGCAATYPFNGSCEMKSVFSVVSLMTIAGLSGCASNCVSGCAVPAPPVPVVQVAPPAPTCGSCKVAPYYAVAVTRPADCNDYPVTYRVQIPEVDDRIRPVDRPHLISNSGVVNYSKTAPCCR